MLSSTWSIDHTVGAFDFPKKNDSRIRTELSDIFSCKVILGNRSMLLIFQKMNFKTSFLSISQDMLLCFCTNIWLPRWQIFKKMVDGVWSFSLGYLYSCQFFYAGNVNFALLYYPKIFQLSNLAFKTLCLQFLITS